MILKDTIKKASQTLKNHNISSHELDAEVILANIMGVNREFFIINNNLNTPKNIISKYNLAIKRRIKKEPVAYITGKKEFWSENFEVNKKTLVPRPETELLLYKIINFFQNKRIHILDIGTGSGCILLSLLKELKFSTGIGIDISSKAIEIAKKNAKNLNLIDRSNFKVFDLKKYCFGKYDLIVSNPPYIRTRDLKNLSQDIVKYEPRRALNGGLDGLDLIKKVIYKSSSLLKKNGLLAIEIGRHQHHGVMDVLLRNGLREIGKEYDYNRNVRCIISTKAKFF